MYVQKFIGCKTKLFRQQTKVKHSIDKLPTSSPKRCIDKTKQCHYMVVRFMYKGNTAGHVHLCGNFFFDKNRKNLSRLPQRKHFLRKCNDLSINS